jgi:hypothetical protein
MKKLTLRSLLFALPFLIIAAIVATADPYMYFDWSPRTWLPMQEKKAISHRLNYALWKTIEFRRSPAPNLLLGDSRMARLEADRIESLTGERFFNMGLGGGNVDEMCDAYFFAAETTRLRSVTLGVSFNLMSDGIPGNRVAGAMAMLDNPLLYLVNRNVLEATVRCLWASHSGPQESIEKPKGSRKSFWQHQVQETAKRYYGAFRYSNRLLRRLRSVVGHARSTGCKVQFVILPTHVDLQGRIDDFGLRSEEQQFISDLSRLAPVVHFDYASDLTADSDNFSDPYHAGKELTQMVEEEIWGRGLGISTRYEPPPGSRFPTGTWIDRLPPTWVPYQ